MRVLVVDDDAGLTALIRATFDAGADEIVGVGSCAAARRALAHARPDAVVLDVGLPGESGLDLCRELKAAPHTAALPVVLLSGSTELTAAAAKAAGADAFLPKPFSPLQLLGLVERLAGGTNLVPALTEAPAAPGEDAQLLLYARDLQRVLELERAQRRRVQEAYGATVGALAEALETKDTGTRAHSSRVHRYAVELMRAVEPSLAADIGVEYGFMLHDIGKIGISDVILQKPGPLSVEERHVMEQHPLIGYEMLRNVEFLRGEGLSVVRSHHERWDGTGYPDRLAGTDIPLAARIFAVADALDAMTSDRPYRNALAWADAAAAIAAGSGAQFDPRVVAAFQVCEPRLRSIRRNLVAA
jgi:ribonuclease P protein subunit RPR2